MTDLKALIAKQREKLESVRQESVDVVLGGELVTVTAKRAMPDVWDKLVASNPPRRGVESDSMVGYNPKGVSRAYPDMVVDGEIRSAEDWAEMFDVLESPHKNNIGVLIWGINVNEVLKELSELGKARAGRK